MARLASGAPDAIALIDAATARCISYGELDALVAAAAARLRADAGPGGLAALFAGNDVDAIVELLGALAAGVPVMLLDRALDPTLAAGVLARYRPEVVRGRAGVALGGGHRGGVAPGRDLGAGVGARAAARGETRDRDGEAPGHARRHGDP